MAKKQGGEVVALKPGVPEGKKGSDIIGSEAMTGQVEKMGAEDVVLPMLSLIQPSSPQLVRGNEKYVKGAQAGDIWHNITNDVFSGEDGVPVISCAYRRTIIEWWPRDPKDANVPAPGQGFVKEWPITTDLAAITERDEKNNDWIIQPRRTGTYLELTHQHYCLLLEEDEEGNFTGKFSQVLVNMVRTRIVCSKRWNTDIGQVQASGGGPADRWSLVYKLKAVPKSKGDQNWFIWGHEFHHALTYNELEIFKAGKMFVESIRKGLVSATPTRDEDEIVEGSHTERPY